VHQKKSRDFGARFILKNIEYPYKSAISAVAEHSCNWFDILLARFETFKVLRRERRRTKLVDIRCLRNSGPTVLGPDDVGLIMVVRNEAKLLPSLLAHYRRLGVSRFVCLDDQSDDGTREFLLSHADVDVWESSVRFKEARRGQNWREMLLGIYGADRWYLNIDSDEFLVYENWESVSIREVIRKLDDAGETRLAAPMLDLYPIADPASMSASDLAALMPWQIADHFDCSGYRLRRTKRGVSLTGGSRARKFGTGAEMMKFPLLYWDGSGHLGGSIHRPLPYERNFGAIRGILLHFKFLPNYREKFVEAIADKQHFNDQVEYRGMLSVIEKEGHLDLASDRTIKFENVEQLMELGFLLPIDLS
jgi:hypothetical protein